MRNPKRYQVFVPGDPKVAGDRDLMADAMGLAKSVSRARGKSVTILDTVCGDLKSIECDPAYRERSAHSPTE